MSDNPDLNNGDTSHNTVSFEIPDEFVYVYEEDYNKLDHPTKIATYQVVIAQTEDIMSENYIPLPG